MVVVVYGTGLVATGPDRWRTAPLHTPKSDAREMSFARVGKRYINPPPAADTEYLEI